MGHRRQWIACLFFASFLPASIYAAAEAPAKQPLEESILLRVDGTLNIDTQGVPVEYQIKTALPQNISDALQRRVRAWRFDPAQTDGKPTTIHTLMRITLATEKNDGKHPIRIDHVNFFHPDVPNQENATDTSDPVSISLEEGNGVRYPYAGLSREINADVLVYAHVTPVGRVDKAFVSQVALLNITGRQNDLRDMAKVFEDEAVADVRGFRFRVAIDQTKLSALQASDPDSVESVFTVRFPVEFIMLGSASQSGTAWQQEVRTPIQLPPWLNPHEECGWPGVADLVAGDLLLVSTDCPHLTTPVVDTTL